MEREFAKTGQRRRWQNSNPGFTVEPELGGRDSPGPEPSWGDPGSRPSRVTRAGLSRARQRLLHTGAQSPNPARRDSWRPALPALVPGRPLPFPLRSRPWSPVGGHEN